MPDSDAAADEADDGEGRPQHETMKLMLKHLQPGETVTQVHPSPPSEQAGWLERVPNPVSPPPLSFPFLQALRRLGGGKKAAAGGRKWMRQDKKKAAAAAAASSAAAMAEDEKSAEDAAADKAAFLELTGYADELLGSGCYTVYQDTYEKLVHEAKALEEQAAAAAAASAAADDDGQAKFVYKWEDSPDAEIHGPFSASNMLQWQQQGFFGANGVFCREVGKVWRGFPFPTTATPVPPPHPQPSRPFAIQTEFYNSKRIDFDLYT